MAIHPHNTPLGVNEPGLPALGLLRSHGAPCRVLSHGEMLALIEGERPELPPEPLLAAAALEPHGGAPYPRMTAADFGMGMWWHDPLPTDAQTARSEGDGPFPINLLDHAGLDSLDEARLHYARRMAADAVDHLIALMDAIDARTEDLEPQAGFDLPEGDDERCASSEVDDEEEPDREDDTCGEPSLASPENHDNQTSWGHGGLNDGEDEDEDDATAPERHGKGFVRCGPDDYEPYLADADNDCEMGDDNGIADVGGVMDQWGSHAAGGGYLA